MIKNPPKNKKGRAMGTRPFFVAFLAVAISRVSSFLFVHNLQK
jgi:hypothetical protein